MPDEIRSEFAEGRIRLPLPPKALEGVLTISAPEHAPHQVTVLSTGRRNVELGTIALREGGEIQGVILDEDGNPIPNARIRAAPRGVRTGKGQAALFRRGLDADQAREARSDEKGEFRISGLPYGRLALRADKEGFLSVGVGEILLEPSSGMAFTELTMRKGRTLRIDVVSDLTNQPVEGAEIELFAANWQPEDAVVESLAHRKGRTSKNGSLVLHQLGRRRPYLVKAKAAGYFTPDDMTLEADSETFLIRMKPAGKLLLSVRGQGGKLIADPDVRVMDPKTAHRISVRVLSREEAWQKERVRVGTGVVLVSDIVQRRVSLVVRAPGYATRIVDVAAIDAGDLRPVDVELPREVPLSGRVLTFDGRPVAGAEVVARRKGQEARGRGVELALLRGDLSAADPLNGHAPSKAPERITVHADDEGRFRIEGLGAGEFDLEARHPEHRTGETSCVLQEGSALEDLEIRLPVEGRIQGRVTWAGGRPAAGASVIVTLGSEMPSGGMALLIAMEGAIARCWSENDGTFRLGALPPGAYRVSAAYPTNGQKPDEWPRAQGNVIQVSAGKNVAVDLVLVRGR